MNFKLALKPCLFALISCNANQNEPQPAPPVPTHQIIVSEAEMRPDIEILYFYNDKRNANTTAIKKWIKETCSSKFANELDESRIESKFIEIKGNENTELVTRYEITDPTILVIDRASAVEQIVFYIQEDLDKAIEDPKEFKNSLTLILNDMLDK